MCMQHASTSSSLTVHPLCSQELAAANKKLAGVRAHVAALDAKMNEIRVEYEKTCISAMIAANNAAREELTNDCRAELQKLITMACSINSNANMLVLREEPSKHKDETFGSLTLDPFAADICGRSVSFHSGKDKESESLDDALDDARLPLHKWSAMLNTAITLLQTISKK